MQGGYAISTWAWVGRPAYKREKWIGEKGHFKGLRSRLFPLGVAGFDPPQHDYGEN